MGHYRGGGGVNKILITGAAGRLGGNLTHQALARGLDVRALVLPDDPKVSKLDGLDVEVVEGDLRDRDLCNRLVEGVDGVIHTANILGPSGGMDHGTFFEINVTGTWNLLEAAAPLSGRLERFVHVSSDGVYPMGNHQVDTAYEPVDELHPKRPLGLYATLKYMGEAMVEGYRQTHGLRTSMIRPAGMFAGQEVLGRWSVAFVAARIRQAAEMPGSGLHHPDGNAIADDLLERAERPDKLCAVSDEEGRPWIYSPADARDVAHACLCALEHPAAVGEVFNAAIPRPFTFPEVAAYLSEKTGESVLEATVPVRWVYWSDVRKAKSTIGYVPKGDLERVFDTALADKAGEPADVIPA